MAKLKTKSPSDNPLSRQDYHRILEAQRNLHDILPIIDSAENCGLPCDEFREVHRFLSEKFNAIIKEFFNPPPA